MKEQFYLSVQDLWSRKKSAISLLFQMTLMLVLLQFIFAAVFDLQKLIQEVGRISQHQNVYILVDYTSRERWDNLFHMEDPEKMEESMMNMVLFYEFLFENENLQTMPLFRNPFLPSDERFAPFGSEMGSTMSFMYATPLLEEFFNLQVSVGRFFNEADYSEAQTQIPVVLGHEFNGIFEIGDTFEDHFHGDLEIFEVVGFLEADLFYVNVRSSWDIQYFDRIMLRPLNRHYFQGDLELLTILSSSVYIFPESTDNMREIVAYAEELELFSLLFRNIDDQLDLLVEERLLFLQSQVFLTALVIILTIVSFTISLLQFIDKRRYEFGVHYLVGATNKDISMRVAFQTIPFLIIGNVTRFILLHQMDHGILTMGVSLGLTILICLIPLVKMDRLNLSSVIRWRVT